MTFETYVRHVRPEHTPTVVSHCKLKALAIASVEKQDRDLVQPRPRAKPTSRPMNIGTCSCERKKASWQRRHHARNANHMHPALNSLHKELEPKPLTHKPSAIGQKRASETQTP